MVYVWMCVVVVGGVCVCVCVCGNVGFTAHINPALVRQQQVAPCRPRRTKRQCRQCLCAVVRLLPVLR